MVEQLKIGVDKYFKKKVFPFVFVFYLLMKGKPFIDLKSIKYIFKFLKIKNIRSKHYGDNYGLGITKSICDVVLEKTENIVKNSKNLVICWWCFDYWPSILDIRACVCCGRMEKDVDFINFGVLGRVRANSFFKVFFMHCWSLEEWHRLT